MRRRLKLSKKVKDGFRQYYSNRKRNKEEGAAWNKQADLKVIFEALPKNCVYKQASAGTFWLTWKRPRIQTVHSEHNWWTCKVLNRLMNGQWIKVSKDWA